MKSCNNCVHDLVCEAKIGVLAAAAAHFMKQKVGGMDGVIAINDGIKSVLGENCTHYDKEV